MKRTILFPTIAACVVTLTVNSRDAAAEVPPPISIHRPVIAIEVWIIEPQGQRSGRSGNGVFWSFRRSCRSHPEA